MRMETERLIIKNPQPQDFEGFWEMRNDPQVMFYTGGVTKKDRDTLYLEYREFCENFTRKNSHKFSLYLKTTGDYMGYCGFQYCDVMGENEILYGISHEFWGQGYAFEAAHALLPLGIRELGYDKLFAAVNPMNHASEKILQKIGMEFTGIIDWPGQGKVHKYVYPGRA